MFMQPFALRTSPARVVRPVPMPATRLMRPALVLLVFCTLLLDCGRHELHAAQVLRLGMEAGAPAVLDPHLCTGADAVIADMAFNALLRFRPGDSAVIEPDLAEALPKPKIEGGKQVWTFALKKGVMFQPVPKRAALEMKSDDVVYSLKKAADPLRSAYAYHYAGMSFRAQGPYTVQVVLDKPMSTTLFLPRFADRAGGAVLCRKASEDPCAQDLQRPPVGTGPFAFKDTSTPGVIALEAHKEYFRGEPRLDGVEVVYLPDSFACEQAFRRGELHLLCGQRSSRWIEKAASWDATTVEVFGPAESLYLVFNTRSGPLSDRKARQAIAHALARREFVDLFGEAVADRLHAHVPPDVAGAINEKDIRALGLAYDTDLTLARRLLGQALAAGRPAIRIECAPQEGERALYEVLRRRLERIGIAVILGDPAAESGRGAQSVGQTLEFRWAVPATADKLLTSLLAEPDSSAPGVPGYRKLDTMLEAARRETGLKKQQEIWRHAQLKLLQDMAVYPICTTRYVVARKYSVDYGYALSNCHTPVPPITEKTCLQQ